MLQNALDFDGPAAVAEQHRLLMEAVADHAVFLLDADGRVATWNAGAESILGFSKAEILGSYFGLFFTPEDRESGVPERQLTAATTMGRTSGDCWLVRKDGSRLWAHGTTTVLKEGGPVGFAHIIRDITERRQAEDALHREREFLRAVLESIQEAVIACDSKGNFTFVNRVTHELGEPVREQIPAEEWMRHFSLYQPDRVTPMTKEAFPLFKALEGERLRDMEMVLVPHKGAPHTVLASGQPLLDAQGNKLGAVVALHDISDRRRLEQQFIQSQKMEAIGRLAGGISHDFNNHLTVINGCGHMLLGAFPPGDPARDLVFDVIRAGEKAAILIRQLLSFSRPQGLNPVVLDLNAVVINLEKMLRRVIGEDIDLGTNLQPTLGCVKVDPSQIEQVVMNLVVNARDAMPRGGKLTIETRNVRLDESYCRTHADVRPGAYVMLAVSDTGSGMTEEIRDRIFEPFFTTKEKGEGTGLGLAMAYGFVKQSRGQIEVYSEPGVGTTFKVYLPRVKGVMPGGASWHGMASAPPGNETVLLVEDDSVVRSFSRAALQQHGYVVLEARDGLEAMEVLEQHDEPVHLLVTDVVLPNLSGPQLAERLVRRNPELKVLFISGYPDDAVVRHGVLQEKVHFLQKPFSPEVLAHKVREALDVEL